ncbi:hypothetical protein ABH942_000484 [Flavobacterium sp. 28YEA47A]|uniref:hypothetical protein n=1 Tax=Flavobacterium sp. 28YEA47A TaxID=3156276 RepID=UPI003516BE8F
MYQTLTFLHSTLRWFVLISLIISLYKAYRGYSQKTAFTKTDNAIRHWTATIAHLQLMVGITLYFQSPIIKYFLKNFSTAKENFDLLFFGLIHSTLMLIAVIVITIGSAMAKRKTVDNEKFKTILIWYGLALLLILIAIPWPFSPFANRPYFR